MANVVTKSAFIEAMISSGRHPEEAELDWIQYLEDMADYRAHKYGNVIDYSPYAEPDSNWVEDDGGLPDMYDMEDYQPTQYELDMEARAKWVEEPQALHSSWNKPTAKIEDWDEIPF